MSLQLFTALDRLTDSPLGMQVCARHNAGHIACFISFVHAVWLASMMRRRRRLLPMCTVTWARHCCAAVGEWRACKRS